MPLKPSVVMVSSIKIEEFFMFDRPAKKDVLSTCHACGKKWESAPYFYSACSDCIKEGHSNTYKMSCGFCRAPNERNSPFKPLDLNTLFDRLPSGSLNHYLVDPSYYQCPLPKNATASTPGNFDSPEPSVDLAEDLKRKRRLGYFRSVFLDESQLSDEAKHIFKSVQLNDFQKMMYLSLKLFFCTAGRGSGKSYLACVIILITALENRNCDIALFDHYRMDKRSEGRMLDNLMAMANVIPLPEEPTKMISTKFSYDGGGGDPATIRIKQ